MLKVFSCIDNRTGAIIFGCIIFCFVAPGFSLKFLCQLVDKDYKSTTERNIVITNLTYSILLLISSVCMVKGIEKRLYCLVMPWLSIWGFGTAVIFLNYNWYIMRALLINQESDDAVYRGLGKMLIFTGLHNYIWNRIYLIYIEIKVSSKASVPAPAEAVHTTEFMSN